MNEQLKDRDRLNHMLDAAQKAVSFTQGLNQEKFYQDEKLTFALLHLLEILGEAASKISLEFRKRHSEIPWTKIAGTRNKLAHGYFDVDLDIIWQIVNTQLPTLITQLEKLTRE